MKPKQMIRKPIKCKPIRRRVVIGLPIQRIPDDGYLNPRMHPTEVKKLPSAIGFNAVLDLEDDE